MQRFRRACASASPFHSRYGGRRAGAVFVLLLVLEFGIGVGLGGTEAQAQQLQNQTMPAERVTSVGSAGGSAESAARSAAALADSMRVNVGLLVQADYAYSEDLEASAFEVRAARLRAKAVSHGIKVFIQTELTRSPAIFDARFRVPLHERVQLTAGLYKAPFSASFLRSRIVLPLDERPRVVNRIAPNRQIGASLGVDVVPDRLHVEAGAYNGTGSNAGNDNRLFLYVARADAHVPLGDFTLQAGINGAASIDDGARVRVVDGPYRGRRMAGGVDASISGGGWLLSGEALALRLDPTGGAATQSAWGTSLTAGAPLTDDVQLVARYDTYQPAPSGARAPDLISAGANVDPTPHVRIQVTGGVPIGTATAAAPSPRGTYATVRLQFALR